MRPDFQCGCCRQLVPEQYYGGCCAICDRIRCNNCMRQCPVCGAQLCPDCLGPARADGACGHAALPPPRPLVPDYRPPTWQPPPRATSPLREDAAPASQPRPARWLRWAGFLLGALACVLLYALLELMVADFAPLLALPLAALLGGGELPAWLARAALPLAWLLACALVVGRAAPRIALLPVLATLLAALALERWIGLNEFAAGIGLPLVAALAGLCIGGGFAALWSHGWSWMRAGAGALAGLAPLAWSGTRLQDASGLAFVLVHLLLLALLPWLLRGVRAARVPTLQARSA